MLYLGSAYHGGGANRSDAVRIGMNVDYNVGWLRQEENQYLAVPLEVARTLPESLQRLIGYARGAYALGYVGDLRDPIELLRPEAAAPASASDPARRTAASQRGLPSRPRRRSRTAPSTEIPVAAWSAQMPASMRATTHASPDTPTAKNRVATVSTTTAKSSEKRTMLADSVSVAGRSRSATNAWNSW